MRGFLVTINWEEMKFLQFVTTLREKKLETVTPIQQSPLKKIRIVLELNVRIVSEHIPVLFTVPCTVCIIYIWEIFLSINVLNQG